MAAALLAGSAINFANAEELRRGGNVGADFKSGEIYYFAAVTGSDTIVYGFADVPGKPDEVKQIQRKIKSHQYAKDEYKNFLWTVTEDKKTGLGETPAKYGYTLTNLATGKTLTFDANGNVDTDYSDNGTLDEKATFIYFGNNAAQYKTYTTAQIVFDGFTWKGSGSELFLHGTSGLMRDANNQMNHTFCFVEYKEGEIAGSELNDLYNSIGFNMNVKGESDQAAIKNLFATSGRVLALDVDTEVKSPNNSTDGAAYPKGTYFVTSVPASKTWAEVSAITDPTKRNNAQYAFLEECTFIAVNSVENDINGKDEREGGIGFQLTTVTGRNLQKYQGIEEAKKATGRDIAVVNACFNVKKNASDLYAIGLDEFRYNKAKAADITDQGKQEAQKNFWLNVTEKGGEDNDDKYLTTHDATPHYIFSLEDIATTSVYSWLKNEKKMSTYNIQFVSDNDDINGKYLFVPAYGNKAYAKSAKFTDTNMPETQFVVTDVDAKNNTVTFTNRANRKMNEKVKIYAEADGTYTIALEDKSAEFAPLNVLENGDIEAKADVPLHGLRVNITPVESIDFYYGTKDVDNLTEVTLLFARDNTPTSNKLYVKSDYKNGQFDNGDLQVTNELDGTLQFRLVKSKEPVEIPYGYAYYLGEAGKEQEKWEANGDTIAYYTYSLEAYAEGVPSNYYLDWNNRNQHFKLTEHNDVSTAMKFIIKDNVDGSVQLINATNEYSSTKSLFVEDWQESDYTIKQFKDNNIVYEDMTQEMEANYVKTYLNLESPEVSLDPTSTYITMKNDINSYYLAKTADGEAILDDVTTLRLFVTDADRQVPNFLVSTGWNESTGEREFLFNPQDSVNYYVAKGEYNKKYQWDNIKGNSKLIFKTGKLSGTNAANDTIYTSIKGVDNVAVTNEADQNAKNVQAGLNFFKFQIVADPDADGLYMMRQNGQYLASQNGRLTLTSFGDRKNAIRFEVADVDAPTANETINAANNVVVAGVNGAVVVKGAEGKNVIVSTILGKVVANEVVSSDNATIAAPQGVVVVSVDGESFKVVVK